MLPVSRPVLRTISHSTPEIGDGWSNTLHSSFEPETCPGIHRATRVDHCQFSPSLSRPVHIWWHETSSWFVCCCSQCKGAKRLVGPEWRSVSRAAHDMLSLRACLSHLPTQYAESARLMFDLLKHPKVSHRSATLKWVHLKSLCVRTSIHTLTDTPAPFLPPSFMAYTRQAMKVNYYKKSNISLQNTRMLSIYATVRQSGLSPF